MIVTYFGGGCFRVQSGDTSLIVDSASTRLRADLKLRTLTPTDLKNIAQDEIVFPGEYEIRGIEVRGWGVEYENNPKFIKTIYRVDWEDIALIFLGHIAKELTSELADKIGDHDILILPAGGKGFLSAQAAIKLIKQLAPSVAILSFIESSQSFAKEAGAKVEVQEKLVFKKKDLKPKAKRIVVLKAGGS